MSKYKIGTLLKEENGLFFVSDFKGRKYEIKEKGLVFDQSERSMMSLCYENNKIVIAEMSNTKADKIVALYCFDSASISKGMHDEMRIDYVHKTYDIKDD